MQSGLRKMLSDETATSAGAVARQFSSDAGLATRSELRSILSISTIDGGFLLVGILLSF